MKSEIVPTVSVYFDDGYSLVMETSPDNPNWTRWLYRQKGSEDKEILTFPNESMGDIVQAMRLYKIQLEIINETRN